MSQPTNAENHQSPVARSHPQTRQIITMPRRNLQPVNGIPMFAWSRSMTARIMSAVWPVCAFVLLTACVAPASAASLSRSVEVNGTPAAVWSLIGPFCAIKDWHPAIGTCTMDSNSPQTRTLVTKDGKATFVELQTARNDADHSYSYTIKSSPLPVTQYLSTLSVTAKSKDTSTVTWSSTYTPDPGKENDASDALSGIYMGGLDAIRTRLLQ